MPYPTITPLSGVPNRSQEPEAFSDSVDTFFQQLPPLVVQINAAGDYIETVGAQVDADKLATAASALAADASADAALVSQNLAAASADYKGVWLAQTGAANKPYSVSHNGSFWALNVNLANVTTQEPSLTNANWQFISGTRWQPVQTAAFTAARNTLYSVTATASTLNVTLPVFGVGDFFVIVNNPASTQLARIVKPGVTVAYKTQTVAAGDNITLRAGETFRAFATSSTTLVAY